MLLAAHARFEKSESEPVSTSGPNACGFDTTPCVEDLGMCATGIAAGATAPTNWFCELDVPTGALPAGSGMYCYDTSQNCLAGPNGCDGANPCELDLATCATGAAGGLPDPAHNWICPLDLPLNGLPNGAGHICYTDAASCNHGPNSCHAYTNLKAVGTGSVRCTFEPAICATGQAGGATSGPPYNFFCMSDMPAGSVPTGSGALCYDTLQARCARDAAPRTSPGATIREISAEPKKTEVF